MVIVLKTIRQNIILNLKETTKLKLEAYLKKNI